MQNEIKVWDPLVRLFHWTLVGSFTIAMVSGDDFTLIHSWAGYTILSLLIIRIVWGVIGTRYARFTDFVKSPSVALHYIKDLLLMRAPRYVGHNPAGGLMIIALITSLLITSVMGLIILADEENAGPLAGRIDSFPHWLLELLEETHEAFAYFTLALVIMHVVGVFIEMIFHGENLIASMINGRKRRVLK